MYQIEIRHEGLHKYRMIKGQDPYVVEQKARIQEQVWDEIWERRLESERKRQDRHDSLTEKQKKKQWAIDKTDEAKEAKIGRAHV